jgi:hypothetical protein
MMRGMAWSALYQKFETYIPRNETAQPRSQFLCFKYVGAIYSFPRLDLFEISFFLYWVRELLAQPQERREGRKLPPSRGWQQFPSLASTPVVEPRVHINDQHTNLQFGKLCIISGNNLSL